jgi:hypothetical protein
MIAMPFFENEEQMKGLLIKWLRDNGFVSRRGLYVKSFEIDIAALAPARIIRDGMRRAKDRYVYAFETKIATSHKLVKDVVEQAIIRLLAVDYVYVVVPKKAETWKDSITRNIITPSIDVNKRASGTYSRNIGIIAIETDGTIEIVRTARKSGLTIKELRELVLRELSKEEGVKPLY